MADRISYAQTSHGATDDDDAAIPLTAAMTSLDVRKVSRRGPLPDQSRHLGVPNAAELASRRFHFGWTPAHWSDAHDGRTEHVDDNGLPIP